MTATTCSAASGPVRSPHQIMPRLAALGHDDIVLNSCITSENLEEINALADMARAWGVNLCYSALFRPPHRLPRLLPEHTPSNSLRSTSNGRRPSGAADQTSVDRELTSTLDATRRYSSTVERRAQGRPGFLVVTADGFCSLAPMQFKKYPLESQSEMVRGSARNNTATSATVSIRSYLDKKFSRRLLVENVSGFLSIKPRLEPPAEA